jgi:adenosine deaminase
MSSQNQIIIPDWLLTMPKVELHVHLEGTVGPEALWQLARRHGVDLGVTSEQGVAELFRYTDFTHFIDTFTMCSDCLRTADDLGAAVEVHGDELVRQNVRYAEMHFNPEPHYRRRGISYSDALGAMNAARARLLDRYGLELRWIADGVRDAASGPGSVDQTVDWMIEAGPDSGVVALGLGGNEIGNPPHLFATAFQRAREAGFHVVAHAGEATGPDTIWDTLRALNVERIGHGVSAAQDPRLLAYLAERRIPLEICPTSNICTGVASSVEELPFKALIDAGVLFSINSDDPPMFGTDLATEYALVAEALNLDRQSVARLVASAIDQSFADNQIKNRLHCELAAHTPFE